MRSLPGCTVSTAYSLIVSHLPQEAWKRLEAEAKLRPFANNALALETVLSPEEAAKAATLDWLSLCVQQLEEAIELLEVRRPALCSAACPHTRTGRLPAYAWVVLQPDQKAWCWHELRHVQAEL